MCSNNDKREGDLLQMNIKKSLITNKSLEYADDGHITQYCVVEVEFEQTSHASHHDQNLIEGKLGYIGKIQEIMQVDLSSFQCVIFCCKRWDTLD
jgi:hypothetical protein